MPTLNREYRAHRNRMIAYGRWEPYVNAEPVRQHVAWLVSQGVPLRRLEPVYPSVRVLMYGRPSQGKPPLAKLRADTAARVFAIQPTLEWLGPHARVPADAYRRRLQGLNALGWPRTHVASEMGAAPSALLGVMTADTVTADMARRIVAVYDRLSMVRPEGRIADMTRRWAADQGCLPPLAWDDDLLDLTDAELDAELDRRVAAMDDDELRACSTAYRKHGERSPEIARGALVYRRRMYAAGAQEEHDTAA